MSTSTFTADPQNIATNTAPTTYSFLRLMFWNMRRELWENRSIIIAPFVATSLVVLAILIPVFMLLTGSRQFEMGTNIHSDWVPYVLTAAPALIIGALVAVAYSINALHGERRDRSILFWKSLPVSDFITVLSKASVPLVLVPLYSFLAALVAQFVTFALALAIFPLFAAKAHMVWNGITLNYHTAGLIWSGLPVAYLTFATLYGALTTALWLAPIYAWLLLVGGWARRLAFLWAVAPVAGLILIERVAFGTHHLEELINHRLSLPDIASLAFSHVSLTDLPSLTPDRLFSDSGLWGGLAVAALFLGAAVLQRRYRQPI